MTEWIPCPIPGCPHKAYAKTSLFGHLYTKHNKATLVAWILQHLES